MFNEDNWNVETSVSCDIVANVVQRECDLGAVHFESFINEVYLIIQKMEGLCMFYFLHLLMKPD
jgi:hypothetical protein